MGACSSCKVKRKSTGNMRLYVATDAFSLSLSSAHNFSHTWTAQAAKDQRRTHLSHFSTARRQMTRNIPKAGSSPLLLTASRKICTLWRIRPERFGKMISGEAHSGSQYRMDALLICCCAWQRCGPSHASWTRSTKAGPTLSSALNDLESAHALTSTFCQLLPL